MFRGYKSCVDGCTYQKGFLMAGCGPNEFIRMCNNFEFGRNEKDVFRGS